MDKFYDFWIKFLNPILVIIIGLIFIKIAVVLLRHYLLKTNIDKALHKFILNFVKTILLIIVFILLLDSLNVDTKSIVTVLGISGGAIALALKDSLSNIAGGIIILLTKPFSAGDFVDVGGTLGKVKQIDMLITTLITTDNKIATIPNGSVSSSVITNYSRADIRRIDCIFSVDISRDINKAKDIILRVTLKNPLILSKPEAFIGVSGSEREMVKLELKVWCKTDDYEKVKYYLEEKVVTALEKDRLNQPL